MQATIKRSLSKDANRVVTEVSQGSVSRTDTQEAAAAKGIYCDVIFTRNDGWKLGSRLADAKAAQQEWAGQWVSVTNVHTGIVRPIK